MIAIDTNVLVRLIVNDPGSQDQVNLAKDLLKREKAVFIPQIVQVELVWVLETAYGFNKPSVISGLRHLQHAPVFFLEFPSLYNYALECFENHNADFSDCLILSGCLENKHDVVTFDKKFARLKSVKLLEKS